MSDTELAALRRELERERAARLEAEQLLERRSRAMHEDRIQAERGLEAQVDQARVARDNLERALVETLIAISGGFWEYEVATRAMTWSRSAHALFGYEVDGVVPSVEAVRARIHPDDLTEVERLTLQPTFSPEFRVVLPDGHIRWCRSRTNVVFDAQGAPVRLRGILMDITRERTVALQLSRLAEVANRTSNAVVVTNLEGRIEWVNHAFERLTGWPLDVVKGRTPGSFLQGTRTDPAKRAEIRAALAARRNFNVEMLNHARSGRQYWVEIETRVSYDDRGRPTGFVAIESDVTARRVTDRMEALAQRVAAVLLNSESLETAGNGVVAELVKELDVLAAQLWVVEPGEKALAYVCGASAVSAGQGGQDFLNATRALSFEAGPDRFVGVGLPGVAWYTRRPILLSDLRLANVEGELSRRVAAADASGIVTIVAVPVLGPDGVLGVIEVGGTQNYPGHELIPGLLERVAEQVASFLMHERSRRAFRTIFAQSPDALLLVDSEGIVRELNTRAAELFGTVEGSPVDVLIDQGFDLVAATVAERRTDGKVPGHGLFNRGARGVRGAFSAEVSVAATRSSSDRAAIMAVRDLTARHAMEEAVARSLREKETLLLEVHHRVKNNLQIVSSLLTLQAGTLADPVARMALEDTVHRVRSMALVHQQLYGTVELSGVDMADYAASLVESLRASLDPAARVDVRAQKVVLAVDQAVPCGLILNELITNALKHGRSADGTCAITVRVEPGEQGFSLAVSDQGPGISEHGSAASLGMGLLRALVRQLRATLTMDSDHGARVTVFVPTAVRARVASG